MPYIPEEVVEQILVSVTSHHDRNAASLVCRAWYRIERLTLQSVFVCNCYAVRPEHVNERFPCLHALRVKGKPHFAAFNLVPAGWGATAEPWVDACARACPGLEELRLKRMIVTDDCLKQLARSFANLKSLVLVSCEGFSTDGLAAIATNCRGSFAQGNNAAALITLYGAFLQYNSLTSLSGFWDSPRLIIPAIYSVSKNLTCLNLSYSPAFRSAELIEVIRPSQNLQQLWVLHHIGDEGLKVVASSCMELHELRVFPANADVLTSTGVTEQGLVATSSGCRKLNSVLYFCKQMTNTTLITAANNCSRFMSFRLCILEPGSPDAMTGQPLDEGFGAIVQSCKSLRRLSVSGLLTDNVFLYIGMYAERLEMLSVAFAGDTDNGMIYVLNGCKNLKKLEISNSPFSDSALLAGMHRYEAMRSLWMSSCNITLGGCKSLAADMPSLNVEVINEAATIDEADGDISNAKKVEKLYLYRTVAGQRGDVPGFISIF